MKQIAKEGIRWERDPDWGYEVPTDVPGIDLEKYTPGNLLLRLGVPARSSTKLRGERRAWLAKFPGLDPAIPNAVEPA